MKIDTICKDLLKALTDASYNEHTIFNYQGVIRRFKAYCNQMGVTIYTPEFGQTYADDVVSSLTGKFSKNRYHTQGRFIRLINSYYNTGIFDFSMLKRGKVQPANDAHKCNYQEYGSHLRGFYENENTVHFYEYELYYFLQYLDMVLIYDIKTVTPAVVLNYIKSVKQCRQRAVLCGLRRYFVYAERNDLYTAIAGLHAYRHKRIIPTLTDNEQDCIKAVINAKKISYRDAAIVLFGLSTGIRACDLIRLKLSDIDWINETISFKQSKTGNTVCLPLTTVVGNAIANYLSKERLRTDNDFLFVRQLAPFDPLTDHASCHAIVSHVFKKAGISKQDRFFGMHMLRHNAASAMVKREVPIATIAAILGHSNADTTDIYITTDEARLKECVLPLVNISAEVNP
jgi:Site-specific recombinase XerD